jgi:hypothetical protein
VIALSRKSPVSAKLRLEAIRSIFAGKGLGDVQVAILYLILFSCILFPLGLWVFKKGIQKAEREGTLARWA